jgi:hypothetical protein
MKLFDFSKEGIFYIFHTSLWPIALHPMPNLNNNFLFDYLPSFDK